MTAGRRGQGGKMAGNRVAAAIGLVSGLVETGRFFAGLGLDAAGVWLIEPLFVGCMQILVSLGLGFRPSSRAFGGFLFVFGVASIWDGSKFLVAERLIYLLPVAAFLAGLASAWRARRMRSPSTASSIGR
jgi:hypothetical protein